MPFEDLGAVGLYALLPLSGQNHGLGLYRRFVCGRGELNAAREFFPSVVGSLRIVGGNDGRVSRERVDEIDGLEGNRTGFRRRVFLLPR